MSQEEQEQQEEPHQKKLSDPKFFEPKMNFNENDLWRDKTKLLNLRFSKLHSAKILLKLEFDTKDQVLLDNGSHDQSWCQDPPCQGAFTS